MSAAVASGTGKDDAMKTFEGSFAVCITPFIEDGSDVNYASLRRYIEWQIANGSPGLIFLGSTGEFLSISEAERIGITETAVKAAAGRIPILMGTAAEDTREAVRLSRQAEALGVDGLMIIPPFYSTPTDDELYEHYKRISDAVSIPIMVYNNPATANVDLLPSLLARLAEIQNVRYVKESTMDVTRVRDITLLSGGKLTVFGGIMGFESFLEGAKGWVSVASNVVPRETADIYDRVKAGDIKGAWDMYMRILPVIRFVGGIWYVGGTKALLNAMGLPVGNPRPPRLPAPAPLQDQAKALVRQLNLTCAL
jgi:4-hydroxy-tetrahydrodipicolinate synthase